MSYRKGPVVVVRGTWDLFPFGPHEFKIITMRVDEDLRVYMSKSSPIIGPRVLLERVLAGEIPEGPIEFEVESGKVYKLEGAFRPTRGSEHHSAVELRGQPARSKWQALIYWWRG